MDELLPKRKLKPGNPQKRRQQRGVEWESAVRRSFRSLRPHPRLIQKLVSSGEGTPFDYLVILPGLHHGVECKRVQHGARLPYSALTAPERKGLSAWDGYWTPSSLLVRLDELDEVWTVRWRDVRTRVLSAERGSIPVREVGVRVPNVCLVADLTVYTDRAYWREGVEPCGP